MTQKELVLDAISELPDEASIHDIAERVEFLAAIQKGLDQLDRGESIPPGKKSLAYALTYQAEDRTLTDSEVDKAHKKIEDRLVHVLKGTIRGKE